MKGYLLLFIISVSFLRPALSQTITVQADNQLLNEVLIELRDRYGLQLSYDNNQLSSYYVTLEKTFGGPAEAIQALLNGLPLAFKKMDAVYVIYPQQEAITPKKHVLSGTIFDNSSGENLPYVHLFFNGQGMVGDKDGHFSFIAPTDSLVHMRVSYLGFYQLDTILSPATRVDIGLTPSVIGLKEVIIEGKAIAYGIQAGKVSGTLRLNQLISQHLPGNGDNSIFNLLRLQPGILAAGEHTNDLIIWGSYAGQSQVLFDGFTIFGLKNYNDNISAINPYMVKDIQIMKGGYDARYGNRVGGIVNITGMDGSTKAPHMNFNLNNMTLNGYASVPLFKSTSLSMAFRKTYYDLYKTEEISTTVRRRGRHTQLADIYLRPDYNFHDFNVKYSGSFRNGDHFYFSLFKASDTFSYDLIQSLDMYRLRTHSSENSAQSGKSFYYSKNWPNGNNSTLNVSYSGMGKDWQENQQINRMSGNRFVPLTDNASFNLIDEYKAVWSNRMNMGSRHLLEGGLGYTQNSYRYEKDTFDISVIHEAKKQERINAYIQNHYSSGQKPLQIKYGLRMDYPKAMNRLFLQPRVSGTYQFNELYTINAAWGIYNQFITKNILTDGNGNVHYIWLISDHKDVPVLQSQHLVAGLSRHRHGLTLSLEAYRKNTDGLSRIIKAADETQNSYYGNSYSQGVDFYVKQELDKHSLWAAYSLSGTREHFSYFATDEYSPSRHDQRHEFKLAGIFSLGKFYLSANYVYGSGFPGAYLTATAVNDIGDNYYSRLDGAITYKLLSRKMQMETGFSVLNILNRENIKYDNFIRVPTLNTSTINIHAEAVPFTPSVFLNIGF
ncbi:MAG: TonB-dependent receptor plug domain-containing protein [Cyclobacteriaceae bacterium]|nr:TonB-dependent receptor plug domain-containing protein [Cyclobacteriaceae bacterium]